MTKHHAGAPRAQHAAVIDAVRAQRHRGHDRHHLLARVRRPGPPAKIDGVIDQRLDPDPARERRRQHDPGVRDCPVVVETDRDTIQSDHTVNMHHEVTSCAGPRLPSQS